MRLEISLLLVGLLLAVGYQALIGKIRLRDILSDSLDGSPSLSRIQFLVFLIAQAGYYFLKVIDDPTRFPDVPAELLVLFGGSNAAYVLEKSLRVIGK